MEDGIMNDLFDKVSNAARHWRPGPGTASVASSLGCAAGKALIAVAVANPITTAVIVAGVVTCAVVMDD